MPGGEGRERVEGPAEPAAFGHGAGQHWCARGDGFCTTCQALRGVVGFFLCPTPPVSGFGYVMGGAGVEQTKGSHERQDKRGKKRKKGKEVKDT